MSELQRGQVRGARDCEIRCACVRARVIVSVCVHETYAAEEIPNRRTRNQRCSLRSEHVAAGAQRCAGGERERTQAVQLGKNLRRVLRHCKRLQQIQYRNTLQHQANYMRI